MAEAEFYTYVHRKADTGEIFYVGKGKKRRAYQPTQRSAFWKITVEKHGFSVEIVGYFEIESEAFAHEKTLILNLRSSGIKLCNMTNGGEGVSGYVTPPHIRKQMTETLKKTFAKPEVKARRSAAISKAQKGRKFTEAHKSKLSLAHKGVPLSDSHKAGLKKRICTPEHRASLKEANARPDVKARRSEAISKTMKGYVKSDEHRAALSAAAKADWARRKSIAQSA